MASTEIRRFVPFVQESIQGIRLVWKLSSFLHETISPARARAILKRQLERRESGFLYLAETCIYGRRQSPFRLLLRNAGCEYGDLKSAVEKNGLEDTLSRLWRQGVYLTSREFRGDCETVRGTTRFWVHPGRNRNPLAKSDIPTRSSGSRSHGTPVSRDLAYVRDNAVSMILFLEAGNSLASEMGLWSVPGGVTLSSIIRQKLAGSRSCRWFTQLEDRGRKLSSRYRLSALVLRLSGLLAGVPFPLPEYVSLENPLPLVRWMADCLRRGKTPHLFTYASSGVRLAECALQAGVDLEGAQLTLSGEPVTAARLNFVHRCHARALPSMGCVEVGHVAYGCLTPQVHDDMHLLTNLHAVIQPDGRSGAAGLPPQALLFTSLRPSCPLILLNVSLGDQGTLKKRTCGCLQGELGLETHLQDVRSFEKLTSGGMAFLDTEFIRLLEEELPRKFGGGPIDYQLLEDEDAKGNPRLRLAIHPRLGPLDAAEVKRAFLEMAGAGSGADRLASLLWEQADMLTVERTVPKTTTTGKIQHLHLGRLSRR